MEKFRKKSLILAESFDAWRIIPRLILVAYGSFVMSLYLWYRSIPTFTEMKCDTQVVLRLIEANLPLEEIQAIACSVAGTVGGPTAAQSAFVTVVIGLSTAVIGLYTATGRRWESGSHLNDLVDGEFPPNGEDGQPPESGRDRPRRR